jgi:hypothetical protein
MKPPWITAACFFAGVCEWTISPVVAPTTSAPAYFEFVHTKMVRRVRIVGIRVGIIVWKEFLKDGIVGKHVGGGATAGEEFSWWDINFS